jgi:hypothetical protein
MKTLFAVVASLNAVTILLRAWDYEGHRIVNQLALSSLPSSFPAFARTLAARERLAFLAGEPDRWRNSTNLTARHASAPDHYLNIDDLPLYELSAKTASPFRYDFVEQLKFASARNPERFPPIDPAKNADHTRGLVGFLPWTLNEYFAKLVSAFSCLKTFEEHGGTRDEIANAQQNVVYIMGVMGHYAGDAAQPLHTTKHFNGWIGANPKQFNTNRTIHSWIDGGFIRRADIRMDELRPGLRPAKSVWNGRAPDNDVFDEAMAFLVAQSKLVERVYELDRDGKLSPGRNDVTEGRGFIGGQLIEGGQFLGDLWYSAWQSAPIDTYLRGELTRRARASVEQ